jgi:hypothetical protein
MPFASLERPALGVGLLKAGLLEAGVACDVSYLNVDFARLIGTEEYLQLTLLPRLAMAGDWVFAEAVWGQREGGPERYVAEVLKGAWRLDDDLIDLVLRARSLVPAFLDGVLSDDDWRSRELVGFSSVGTDNVAGLSLAWKLKRRFPHLRIAFGGHNWSGKWAAVFIGSSASSTSHVPVKVMKSFRAWCAPWRLRTSARSAPFLVCCTTM